MKLKIVIALFIISANVFAQTKPVQKSKEVNLPQTSISKKEQDKASIKAMCGIYKVSFDFAETFAPDTAYKYHKRYSEWGIEYVFIAEESENKIAIQHLLIIYGYPLRTH